LEGFDSGALPSPAVIVFIPCSEAGCKLDEFDAQWLPRRCPACGEIAVIGHGRGKRQAHDRLHDWVRIRRGLCNGCGRTITVLPRACIPRAVYNLPARVEALTGVADGASLEQAAPERRDPDRIACGSTIRLIAAAEGHDRLARGAQGDNKRRKTAVRRQIRNEYPIRHSGHETGARFGELCGDSSKVWRMTAPGHCEEQKRAVFSFRRISDGPANQTGPEAEASPRRICGWRIKAVVSPQPRLRRDGT
jgi:Domain of unknown function (DUF6431)